MYREYVYNRSSLQLPPNVLTCRLMGNGMPDQVKATFDEDAERRHVTNVRRNTSTRLKKKVIFHKDTMETSWNMGYIYGKYHIIRCLNLKHWFNDIGIVMVYQ